MLMYLQILNVVYFSIFLWFFKIMQYVLQYSRFKKHHLNNLLKLQDRILDLDDSSTYTISVDIL